MGMLSGLSAANTVEMIGQSDLSAGWVWSVRYHGHAEDTGGFSKCVGGSGMEISVTRVHARTHTHTLLNGKYCHRKAGSTYFKYITCLSMVMIIVPLLLLLLAGTHTIELMVFKT